MKLGTIAAAVFCIACASMRTSSNPPTSAPRMRVVGYLASWGVRSKGTRIAQLPAKDLTDIFYAFAQVTPDGRVTLGDPCIDVGVCDSLTTAVNAGGNFAELRRLKERNPNLKLVISIGGWTRSGRFSDASLTDSTRQLFATSAIETYMRQTNGLFDGIDIDWEYPTGGGMKGNVERAEDKDNFILLLAELRKQLDAQGAVDHKHYELAIALGAGPRAIANVDMKRVASLLDFINVMTYDYHSGGTTTGFNSPLYAAKGDPTPAYNIDATIHRLLDAGVPPNKLLVGIPFYGRGYGNVESTNSGLFQTASGRPSDWRDRDGDWSVLSKTRLKDPRYVRYWEADARVPYLHDSTSGTWVSYDDPQSVREKVRYVREHALGGVMIWELGGDDGSLMNAIKAGRL